MSDKPTPAERFAKLPQHKQAYYIECCRRMTMRRPANADHCYFGHIDHFDVADSLGIHRKQSERWAGQFEAIGLWEGRNNYDSWVLRDGIILFEELDNAAPPQKDER